VQLGRFRSPSTVTAATASNAGKLQESLNAKEIGLMAGQTINSPTSQGHTHNLTVSRPNSHTQNISAEPSSDEAYGANWHVVEVEIDHHLCTEEYLRNACLRLDQSSRFATADGLSASIVHQLNQPLTSMLANAQAAKRWLAAEPPNLIEAIASIDRIARNVRGADETMGRIRALFKQESLDTKEASVADMVIEAVRLVQEDPRKREIPIDWDFDGNLPKVSVDPIPIQEVFINLISNAIEAMEGNRLPPLVKIRAAVTKQNEMLVQVIDNGPGVDDREKIFDAFVTTKATGMGIGLAVSRSIVEAHGGRLWAENDSTGGARFSVTLPLSSVKRYPI
jgi:C4-dicarboxylate-specific signal transduction histidine kinase